jgi:hypothetical protein
MDLLKGREYACFLDLILHNRKFTLACFEGAQLVLGPNFEVLNRVIYYFEVTFVKGGD